MGWAGASQLECTSESSLPMTGLTPKVAGMPVESEMFLESLTAGLGVPHSEQQLARRTLCSYPASLGLEQQG